MRTNELALDFTEPGSLPPDSTVIIKQITIETERSIQTLEQALKMGSMKDAGWRLLASFYLGINRLDKFNALEARYEDHFDAPLFTELSQNNPLKFSCRIVFEMPQRITDDALPDVATVLEACISPKGALLDFTHVRGCDKRGLNALSEFISQLPRNHTKPETPGMKSFISKLKNTANSDDSPEDIWNLLFECQRFCNDLNTFEELSIKYAIHFGISPPSW